MEKAYQSTNRRAAAKVLLTCGLVLLLALYGCTSSGGGGGGGGGTTKTYQLYDDGYYVNGYSKTASLSGTDTDDPGNSLTGTYTITTGAEVLVGSESAIPVTVTLTVTGTSSLIYYYKSSDTGDDKECIRIADISGDPSFTPRAGSGEPLADTASIGDSGTMPTFDGSDGSIIEESWALTAGTGDLANLVITTVVKNAAEEIQYTETVTTTIDESGDPQSVEIKTTYPSSRIVTLSGDYAS
jgi:hypothetical protein